MAVKLIHEEILVILTLYITEACLSKTYNSLIFQIKDTEAPFVMRPPPHPPLQGKFHLYIPFLGIARPQSQFPHSCVCKGFIFSQDRSTYFPAAEWADRSWKYINL